MLLLKKSSFTGKEEGASGFQVKYSIGCFLTISVGWLSPPLLPASPAARIQPPSPDENHHQDLSLRQLQGKRSREREKLWINSTTYRIEGLYGCWLYKYGRSTPLPLAVRKSGESQKSCLSSHLPSFLFTSSFSPCLSSLAFILPGCCASIFPTALGVSRSAGKWIPS